MREDDGPDEERRETWTRKLRELIEAGQRLLSTRAAILREELGAKGALLARGLVGVALAAALACMALLLLTAWIAVALSSLFGNPVLGVLAAFVLFAAVAAAAGVFGVKALSRVKPFEFPVTSEELRKDWNALWPKETPEPPAAPIGPKETVMPSPSAQALRDDLEERFRAGSE